jgi:BirA family biotin operon repressor/biotin-[acetyl-CoA-carboxylase] ligase
MDARSFQAELTTRAFGRALHWVASTGSTNDDALRALRNAEAPHGSVLVAGRQNGGRGTGGRHWLSDHEDGLWFTLVVHEPLPVQPLSFLPAIALVDLVREEYRVDAHLKWPNDVLVEERKLAGFLVESQRMPSGGIGWAIGCGINVNQIGFEPAIRDTAVSLWLCTGRRHELPGVLAGLLARMERLWLERADLVALWPARSRMPGSRLRGRLHGQPIDVLVEGLSPEGHLRLRHDDGRLEDIAAHADLKTDRRLSNT